MSASMGGGGVVGCTVAGPAGAAWWSRVRLRPARLGVSCSGGWGRRQSRLLSMLVRISCLALRGRQRFNGLVQLRPFSWAVAACVAGESGRAGFLSQGEVVCWPLGRVAMLSAFAGHYAGMI